MDWIGGREGVEFCILCSLLPIYVKNNNDNYDGSIIN